MRWFDAQHGWAITASPGAYLLRSADGGLTWQNVTPDPEGQVTSIYSDIYAFNADTAWVLLSSAHNSQVTYHLYHTVDGGKTWQESPSPFTTAQLFFMDERTGWALADQVCSNGCVATLYHTKDGGRTWSRADGLTDPLRKKPLSPGQIDEGIGGVSFQAPESIWRGKDFQTLLVSRDAGKTWHEKPLPPPDTSAGSGRGPVHGVSASLDAPFFLDSRLGFAVERSENQDLFFYRSEDGGDYWTQAGKPVACEDFPHAFRFATARDWFVACGANIYMTHDAGETWEKTPITRVFHTDVVVYTDEVATMDFIDGSLGWVTNYKNYPTGNFIFHTEDGGRTWKNLHPILLGAPVARAATPSPATPVAPSADLFPTAPVANLPAATPTEQPTIVVTPGTFPLVDGFQFIDAQTAFAIIRPKFENETPVPGSSRLFRSIDGGRNWQNIHLPTEMGFLAEVLSAQDFWIVKSAYPDPMTRKDTLYHTQDGGQTWKKIDVPFSASQITMFDDKRGWAMDGSAGCGAGTCWVRLFYTADGGLTWKVYHPQPPLQTDDSWQEGTISFRNGTGFEFQSIDTIWMGGGGGVDFGPPNLSVSRDQGQTWHEIRFDLPENLSIAHINLPTFINEKEGFITITVSPGLESSPGDRIMQAIFATSDGGRTWTPRPMLGPLFSPAFHSSIQFITLTDWFTDCNGALCATHDGGQTWQAQPLPAVPGSLYFSVSQIFDPRNFIGIASFAVKDNQSYPYYQELYVTHDGGQTWTKVSVELK